MLSLRGGVRNGQVVLLHDEALPRRQLVLAEGLLDRGQLRG